MKRFSQKRNTIQLQSSSFTPFISTKFNLKQDQKSIPRQKSTHSIPKSLEKHVQSKYIQKDTIKLNLKQIVQKSLQKKVTSSLEISKTLLAQQINNNKKENQQIMKETSLYRESLTNREKVVQLNKNFNTKKLKIDLVSDERIISNPQFNQNMNKNTNFENNRVYDQQYYLLENKNKTLATKENKKSCASNQKSGSRQNFESFNPSDSNNHSVSQKKANKLIGKHNQQSIQTTSQKFAPSIIKNVQDSVDSSQDHIYLNSSFYNKKIQTQDFPQEDIIFKQTEKESKQMTLNDLFSLQQCQTSENVKLRIEKQKDSLSTTSVINSNKNIYNFGFSNSQVIQNQNSVSQRRKSKQQGINFFQEMKNLDEQTFQTCTNTLEKYQDKFRSKQRYQSQQNIQELQINQDVHPIQFQNEQKARNKSQVSETNIKYDYINLIKMNKKERQTLIQEKMKQRRTLSQQKGSRIFQNTNFLQQSNEFTIKNEKIKYKSRNSFRQTTSDKPSEKKQKPEGTQKNIRSESENNQTRSISHSKMKRGILTKPQTSNSLISPLIIRSNQDKFNETEPLNTATHSSQNQRLHLSGIQLLSTFQFNAQKKYLTPHQRQDNFSEVLQEQQNFVISKDNSEIDFKSRVKVMARFRPLSEQEKLISTDFTLKDYVQDKITFDRDNTSVVYVHQQSVQQIQEERVSVKQPKNLFVFDHVFTPESSQNDIYEIAGRNIIDDALCGYNSTVLAYGQTGSGKTFTMFGKENIDIMNKLKNGFMENVGIIPRVAQEIFKKIQIIGEQSNYSRQFKISVQMVEIYKENLIDLLTPCPPLTGDHIIDDQILKKIEKLASQKQLSIQESPQFGTYIQGLTQKQGITSQEQLIKILTFGENNRHINFTRQNKVSSRSHSICMIQVVEESMLGQYLSRGTINLVDLAGSERVSKSYAKGEALEEAKKINQSLSSLGKVINCIVKNSTHIPYRDSKLTRLLKDSLGGNNKTTLIVNCSMHYSQMEETLSTMRFAQSAKLIQNKVFMNKFQRSCSLTNLDQQQKYEQQIQNSILNQQNNHLNNIVKELRNELEQMKFQISNLNQIKYRNKIVNNNNIIMQDCQYSENNIIDSSKELITDIKYKDYENQIHQQKKIEDQITIQNLQQQLKMKEEENQNLQFIIEELRSQQLKSESSCQKKELKQIYKDILEIKIYLKQKHPSKRVNQSFDIHSNVNYKPIQDLKIQNDGRNQIYNQDVRKIAFGEGNIIQTPEVNNLIQSIKKIEQIFKSDENINVSFPDFKNKKTEKINIEMNKDDTISNFSLKSTFPKHVIDSSTYEINELQQIQKFKECVKKIKNMSDLRQFFNYETKYLKKRSMEKIKKRQYLSQSVINKTRGGKECFFDIRSTYIEDLTCNSFLMKNKCDSVCNQSFLQNQCRFCKKVLKCNQCQNDTHLQYQKSLDELQKKGVGMNKSQAFLIDNTPKFTAQNSQVRNIENAVGKELNLLHDSGDIDQDVKQQQSTLNIQNNLNLNLKTHTRNIKREQSFEKQNKKQNEKIKQDQIVNQNLIKCLNDLQNILKINQAKHEDKCIQAGEENTIELAIFDSYIFKKIQEEEQKEDNDASITQMKTSQILISQPTNKKLTSLLPNQNSKIKKEFIQDHEDSPKILDTSQNSLRTQSILKIKQKLDEQKSQETQKQISSACTYKIRSFASNSRQGSSLAAHNQQKFANVISQINLNNQSMLNSKRNSEQEITLPFATSQNNFIDQSLSISFPQSSQNSKHSTQNKLKISNILSSIQNHSDSLQDETSNKEKQEKILKQMKNQNIIENNCKINSVISQSFTLQSDQRKKLNHQLLIQRPLLSPSDSINTEHDTLLYDKDLKSLGSSSRKTGLQSGMQDTLKVKDVRRWERPAL